MPLESSTFETPWGPADNVEEIGDGIKCVFTSSHGGFFVPNQLLHKIPKAHRAYAKRWSGSENWYEEDCAWASVALAFPQFFEEHEKELARKIAMNYIEAEDELRALHEDECNDYEDDPINHPEPRE